ncbi:MAG: Ig-like domain repeat protein [Terracidiphilus sp.]
MNPSARAMRTLHSGPAGTISARPLVAGPRNRSGAGLGERPLHWGRFCGRLSLLSVLTAGTICASVQAQTVTANIVVGGAPGVAINPATNKIYLMNQTNGVTVLDGATNDTTTITAGNTPIAAAVNPVTNKIYAVNEFSSNVTVIDGATGATATVTVGGTPVAVAVNPITNTIYVANNQSASVTVIDGATNATSTVTVGTFPEAIAVNPVTNKVYVVNSGSSNVTVIDGATNTAAATVNTGTIETNCGYNCAFAAVNPVTNKIYVINGLFAQISVIDGSANTATNVTVGDYPAAIAINPVTNQIYVSYLGDTTNGGVTVVDGTSNNTTSVVDPNAITPIGLAVDVMSNKVYVGNYASNNVTVIDGVSNSTTTLTDSHATGPLAVGVNPVTNKIYVANQGSVTVIDGATYGNSSVAVSGGPVAVNPVTGNIYVVNKGSGNVTVINPATNAQTTVSVTASPVAIAINSVTNTIYVVGNSVTAIDGTTNATSNISCTCSGSSTESIAVNPVTNKIYVAVDTTGVFVIDGASNAITSISNVDQSFAIAVNPVTNTIYFSNTNNNKVTAVNGTNNSATPINVGSNPGGLAVNSVTNTVYVANNGSNNVTVINGANNSTTTVTDPNGVGPAIVAVDSLTNTIYVLNDGEGGAILGTVTVINGATNAVVTNIVANINPVAIAVNPTTNKIYAVSNVPFAPGVLTVIDGATNSASTQSLPSGPNSIAVNPVTNTIYVQGGSLSVFGEQTVGAIPLTTVVTPLSSNQTSSTTPSFTFTATSTFAPTATTPNAVYFQVDSWGGAWIAATPGTGGQFTGTTGALQPGYHILYAFATDGQDAGSTQGQGELGSDNSPIVGNIAAYGFLATGAPANAPEFSAAPSPLGFGNQTEGTTSGAMTLTVTNNGTANLNITTVAASGTDMADFPVGTDNCAGATVGAGLTCTVSVKFMPSIIGGESATLTFTDNAAGSPHVVNLTGTGTPLPLAVTTASLPSGVVSIAYAQTLTATGGVTPYTWSISSGSLPGGLSLATGTGAISGLPTTPGPSTFTVKVKDSTGSTATQSLTITINATLAVTTASLPDGTAGTAYAQTLTATGGVTPYTWSISNGSLPAGLSLTAGTGAISGTPTTAGPSTFTVKVTDSASNTATQILSLTINAPPATATTTVLAASANSVAVGNSITFTATVTPAQGTPTPTGTVTFKKGGTTLGTGTLNGSGVATYMTSSLAVGSYNITASYGGDARNLTSTSNAVSVSVTLGSTTTALTASATSLVVGSSVTFTATVTGASGVPAPTGTVTFMNGMTVLGTGPVNGSGTATYITSVLAVGSYSVTASYGGDVNNSSSTSSAVAVTVWPGPPAFTLTLNPPNGSFNGGTNAVITVTVSSVNGFNAATSLACSNLPKDATCTFSSSPITPAVAGMATSTLTIATNVNPNSAALRPESSRPAPARSPLQGPIEVAGAFAAFLLLPLFGAKNRKLRRLLLAASSAILLAVVATIGITACGSSGPTTPNGTYMIQVNATAGSLSESATYSLTVQ